jgi:hypothetical protein
MVPARILGVVVGIVLLGGLVTAAGRRVTDPLEARGDLFDEPDLSDEPLWIELPLERSAVSASV